MKLKHWQGYGTLNAKKTNIRNNNDGTTTLKVKITGNHEYGIYCDDKYTLENWLIPRFDKSYGNKHIMSININESTLNGEDVADYTLIYQNT